MERGNINDKKEDQRKKLRRATEKRFHWMTMSNSDDSSI